MKNKSKIFFVIFGTIFFYNYCFAQSESTLPAIYNTSSYVHLLKNKNIAVVCNQSSYIHNTHLVDSLLNMGIKIVQIYTPEHGFFGIEDAGEKITNSSYRDIPIESLYGKNKKPSKKSIENIDIVLFDLQDVGVRFYTYISTLHYVIEAATESNKEIIVLDRPNPHSDYIDGPIMQKGFTSFVGMHKGVPVVYGMTIGEYAKMIIGEKWIEGSKKTNLTVVPLSNFGQKYFEIAPSPNLPNLLSIEWYPSLCFFEGTSISVGRGTSFPFQQVGTPENDSLLYPYFFIPKSKVGATHPMYKNKKCFGKKLADIKLPIKKLDISFLLEFYKNNPNKKKFFNNFFKKLAGNNAFQKQIESDFSEKEIRKNWKSDLGKFNEIRLKYLIYRRKVDE